MVAKTATIALTQGPGGWEAEVSSSCSVGELGWDVEQPVAQRFGLAGGQPGSVAGEGEESEPGDQVRGDRGDHQPGLVDLERELLAGLMRCVGGGGPVAPPVAFFEQGLVSVPV